MNNPQETAVKIITRITLILPIFALQLAHGQYDTALFSGMRARSIGPAGMSGRISSICAVESNPDIIFVGAATGGVWKTTNSGINWKPLFDDQPVAAIGAVVAFQANPSIIWVGTGEGNVRNSASVGNGMYKSLDGGNTWLHIGLEKTERIPRIVLNPTDQNCAYVAAMGQMWGENQERGVYQTLDGGKSWKKILYVNERTGCAELVMDPSNPNKLFAAMWEYRRWPWFFKSGGPGSGLYVTYDGGDTWKKITAADGLPQGELGRIGVAIARSTPDVVYALVEAEKSALCRSDDGGRTWKKVNESANIALRPFYFCDIQVDPQNENRLYSLHFNVTASNDGGKTFSDVTTGASVHSDHHALWIHPLNGQYLIDGTDGGVYFSYDRGKTWRLADNIPVAQFYHISVDLDIPFNVYGGMQDNGSWRGPSDVWENSGIRNFHWNAVGFGDGFGTLTDASDPNSGYSMAQGGYLLRFNLKTGERKFIRPWAPDSVALRFNWNAAIAADPFDSRTIYYGSQFIHKSTDRGDLWTIISPDLTTNDTSKQRQDISGGLTRDVTDAENHTTIVAIAPSPVQRGVIWVGTDDGNIQVTQDGGKTWTNVADRVPNVPRNTWVPHIEASTFDAGTAYIVFDNHRRSDWKTYVFKTDDFGKHWTSLTRHDPTESTDRIWGYALTIVQDPVKKGLLFLGTEFGLFVSFDDGGIWTRWANGYPTVSTMALIVHPRDYDLVIGTHGRAAYILDDIRPLRSITKELFEEPLHLFEIAPTFQHDTRPVNGYYFIGDGMFRGETRPYGALVTYSVNPPKNLAANWDKKGESQKLPEKETRPGKDSLRVKIEVLDSTGAVIRKMDGPAKKGLNRIAWPLCRDNFKTPRQASSPKPDEDLPPAGPEILPGKYTLRVRLGTSEARQTVLVLADPRTSVPMDSREKKYALVNQVGRKLELIAEAVDRIQKTRKGIDAIVEQIADRKDSTAVDLRKSADDLKKALSNVSDQLIEPPDQKGLFAEDRTAAAKLGSLNQSIQSSWDAPTDAQMRSLRQAEQFISAVLKEFNQLFTDRVAAFKKKVDAMKFSLFPEQKLLDLDWKRE